mmetsp:Transcript_59170/g.139496  ORF Transcript_59170/g.139496 Transcript_59170/m.139496 type:complete len:383 (+) Transcript_59170:1980-3128(+)
MWCRSEQVRERVSAARLQMGSDVCTPAHFIQCVKGGWLPAWLLVLVDQQCAHALGEVRVHAATHRGLPFETKNLGQGAVAQPSLQRQRQLGRAWGAFGEGGAGLGQPRIGIRRQGGKAWRQILQALVLTNQLANTITVLADRRRRKFGRPKRFGLQEPAQRGTIGFGIALPKGGCDGFQHGTLVFVPQHEVGQLDLQRVGGVQRNTGQRQELAQATGQAREEPTAAHIRVEADGDLRHRQPRLQRRNSVRGASHQPNTTAHHDAVAPAHNGLGIGVDEIVQPVLALEEGRGLGRHLASRRGLDGAIEAHHVATGAEGLVTRRVEPDAGNLRVDRPGAQLCIQEIHHRQRQCIEASRRIQCRATEAVAASGRDLGKQDRRVAH